MFINDIPTGDDPSRISRQGNDELLLRRFLAGDPRASRRLEGWARAVIASWSWSFSREERQDLCQQTLMGLCQAASRPGFRLRQSLYALTRRIALARCIDALRRHRHGETLNDDARDPGPPPDRQAELSEEIGRLRRALDQLGETHREALRLRFLEDRSYAEMARHFEASESYVRGLVFHGIRKLRRRLEGGE